MTDSLCRKQKLVDSFISCVKDFYDNFGKIYLPDHKNIRTYDVAYRGNHLKKLVEMSGRSICLR